MLGDSQCPRGVRKMRARTQTGVLQAKGDERGAGGLIKRGEQLVVSVLGDQHHGAMVSGTSGGKRSLTVVIVSKKDLGEAGKGPSVRWRARMVAAGTLQILWVARERRISLAASCAHPAIQNAYAARRSRGG